jgi:hypothetical protein
MESDSFLPFLFCNWFLVTRQALEGGFLSQVSTESTGRQPGQGFFSGPQIISLAMDAEFLPVFHRMVAAATAAGSKPDRLGAFLTGVLNQS